MKGIFDAIKSHFNKNTDGHNNISNRLTSLTSLNGSSKFNIIESPKITQNKVYDMDSI